MTLYPPHTVTSTDNASTIVGGNQIGDQNRKPSRSIRKHDRATNTEGQRPIIDTERPSFGQWLKAAWPDILTMIIVGAAGLGVSRCLFYSARCRGLTECTGILGTARSQPLIPYSSGRNDRFPRIRLSTPARGRPHLGCNVACQPSAHSRHSDHADTDSVVLGCA